MTAAVDRALAALAGRVLCAAPPGTPRPPTTLLGERFWSAPAEAEALLDDLLGPPSHRATAFGVRAAWPVWKTGAGLVAPGLPEPVSPASRDAAGGAYRWTGGAVLREAAGREAPVMVLDDAQTAAAEPAFELLWFADQERRTVAAGWLQIDDLFACTHLPATPDVVADALRRPGVPRAPEPCPVALSPAAPGPATLEVGRGRTLHCRDSWRDPADVTAARTGVSSVRLAPGDALEAVCEDHRVVRFHVAAGRRGWRLERLTGDDPYDVLEAFEDDGRVVLRVTPVAAVDLARMETRRRIAFDLYGLLVSLAES